MSQETPNLQKAVEAFGKLPADVAALGEPLSVHPPSAAARLGARLGARLSGIREWLADPVAERKRAVVMAIAMPILGAGFLILYLSVMAVWHASFGGAAPNTAVGYLDEGTTRVALDEHWQLIGEVNAMRAYRQSSRAVCFLKWEDIIQKKRNLPAWRVLATGATEADLERIKASVNAHWEEWGT